MKRGAHSRGHRQPDRPVRPPIGNDSRHSGDAIDERQALGGSNAAFDIASAIVPSREKIVTLMARSEGCKVCGSRICPILRPSISTKFSDCADVDTEVSAVSTTPSRRAGRSGSLIPTVHVRLPGGVPRRY
jgi:hypothetical protein